MSETAGSRQKSCGDCVRAKRKCGMEIPKCTRCAKKNIECNYPNSKSSLSDTVIPELDFPWLDDLMQNPSMLPWSGSLQSQLGQGSISSCSMISETQNSQQAIPDYLVDGMEPNRTWLGRTEVDAALRQFKTYPDKWLNEGAAPFIHPHLYASDIPKPLQDAYAACAIFSTKNERNEHVAFAVIEARATELLTSPDQLAWTPLDLLAALQALLIFQFIRLFDGDIRQRALAEEAEPILESWTMQLKARTEVEQHFTTATAPSWRAWVFAESVRRTVTMSVYLCGIYSLVKHGFCVHADAVTANSFTAQRRLWESTSALQWDRVRKSCNPYWITKMEFEVILREAKGDELDDFGMVLLITYNGQDVVDNWLEGMKSGRHRIIQPDFPESLREVTQSQSRV
ncbi:hypothetical protein BCR34DRAFT_562622 [Clohesyomyces aquaticus]|uniref:Zn(2)-C6 fungal-type domain-containing protein n=1 Tax=Clohesyomyces aquaticus TaxID=1231657 RepID=A0A1Y1ZS47_9PLEO|nr:hypothetical protein BCR34DRAFT_562622 [Clohesyomyces aquaticus]